MPCPLRNQTLKSRYSVIANGLFPGLLLVGLIGGCTPSLQEHRPLRDNAFIDYWPPPETSKGLRLAVKDLIDMKGVVTTAGSEYVAKTAAPAARDAACLALTRERQVHIVGKANLTEFAVSVSGRNPYFGTPVNRRDGKHQFIPGGSSSGSAVAVATGRADVAFGTDTAGSIRMPAACCGIYGLKTTYGLVPIRGVFPISPKHLDTVGPMAADLPHLVQGMDLLQRGFMAQYHEAVAASHAARSIRIGRLYLSGTDPEIDRAIDAALAATGFQIIKLDERFKGKWTQAQSDGTTVAFGDAWFNDHKYLDKSGVGATTKLVVAKGQVDYTSGYSAAVKRKAAWQRDLRRIFQQVDFIATPTLQTLPPKFPWFESDILFEWEVFNSQNTVAVNFAGNPALAMPIPMPARGKTIPPTSLQLIGPRLSEAKLLNAARLLQSNSP